MQEFDSILVALIPALTPVVIALVKHFVPKIPKTILPFAAPILGALMEVIAQWIELEGIGIVSAAVLGLAGVGVREATDQVKKQMHRRKKATPTIDPMTKDN